MHVQTTRGIINKNNIQFHNAAMMMTDQLLRRRVTKFLTSKRQHSWETVLKKKKQGPLALESKALSTNEKRQMAFGRKKISLTVENFPNN